MKKMLLGLGIIAALMVGFFAVVPIKKASAFTTYTVYKYERRDCTVPNTTLNTCISGAGTTVYQTIYLAAPPSISCPAPTPDDPGTAWVAAGVTTQQFPGLSCVHP